MSLKLLGKLWRDHLHSGKNTKDLRFFFGFRQREYAPVSGTPGYQLVDADQIAHWRLGEGTGTKAGDQSANRNHGTIAGNPTWTAGPTALGGKALTLDGTGDYVTMGDVLDWDGASARCFTGWIKTATSAAQQWLESKRAAAAGFGIFLDTDGYLHLYLQDASSGALNVYYLADLTDGAWYHFAINYNGSKTAAGVSMYINGAAVTLAGAVSDTFAGSSSNAVNFNLGGFNDGTNLFTGTMADCRIYDRVLTPDEITALYTDGTFNRPGSHLLISGTLQYLVPLTESFTVRVLARPRFAYNVASDQPLIYWTSVTGAVRLTLHYDAGVDRVQLEWRDNGTARILNDATETAATVHEWRLYDLAWNAGGGQTGSALYRDRGLLDGDMGGSPDAMTTQQQIMTISAAGWDIAYVELIPNYVATAAAVANDFRDVLDERIYWGFNGHAVGFDRCKLRGPSATQGAEGAAVMSYGWRQAIENAIGRQSFAQATMVLNNNAGEFSDDQFAAFDPASELYNGLNAYDGKYLQQRPRVWVENWYSNQKEHVFDGRVSEGKFERQSEFGSVSTAEVTALDVIDEIQRRVLRNAVRYVSFNLSKPSDETTSLLHTLARLATKHVVRNYAGDSSFENADPTDTYTANGGGAIVRSSAQALLGTYSMQLTNDADGSGWQGDISFPGGNEDRTLNVGEVFTKGIYVRSATTQNVTVSIAERVSGGAENDITTSAAVSVTGGKGWFLVTVTHEITDETSNLLRISASADGNSLVSYWDCVMVVRGYFLPPFFVLNSNQGTAGVHLARSFAEGSYDTVGFVADDAPVTHPWAHVPTGSNPWEEIRMLCDAAIAHFIKVNGGGSIEFRSHLAAGYVDPAIHQVIEEVRSGSQAASPVLSLTSALDEIMANRIEVQGVRYSLATYVTILWDAKATGDWGAEGEPFSVAVANGDKFPDADDFPDYWADYQEDLERQGSY